VKSREDTVRATLFFRGYSHEDAAKFAKKIIQNLDNYGNILERRTHESPLRAQSRAMVYDTARRANQSGTPAQASR